MALALNNAAREKYRVVPAERLLVLFFYQADALIGSHTRVSSDLFELDKARISCIVVSFDVSCRVAMYGFIRGMRFYFAADLSVHKSLMLESQCKTIHVWKTVFMHSPLMFIVYSPRRN